jgi:ribonuclease R
MLMANETIAEDFFWQELPFVYRSHESPDADRIRRLTILIKNYGYYLNIRQDNVHPKEFQKLLGKIEGTPEETMISRLVLRSMKQARYTTEDLGHFGLAVSHYCHFTSPIRRYPDLQIHRIIKDNINGRLDDNRQSHYYHILPEVATQSSVTERRADEAEREVEKMKKAEYMSKRVGQRYEGVVSGITNWGMYVELPNTCEGLIRLQDLDDDYYIFDETSYTLTGEDTGHVFRLGDRLSIIVKDVDFLSKTVNFLPDDEMIL